MGEKILPVLVLKEFVHLIIISGSAYDIPYVAVAVAAKFMVVLTIWKISFWNKNGKILLDTTNIILDLCCILMQFVRAFHPIAKSDALIPSHKIRSQNLDSLLILFKIRKYFFSNIFNFHRIKTGSTRLFIYFTCIRI